jgi:hypothetical protein
MNEPLPQAEEKAPVQRLDFTVMMGGEKGANRKRAMLFGYQKVHVPACVSCFKTWPEVTHFLIAGSCTMCAQCWKKALEVK